MVEHIVWDWNGTLFADGDALVQSTIDAFQAAGLPPISRLDYQANHRQPISAFYDTLVGRTLTEDEQSLLDRHFDQAYLRRREAIPLTHDAIDAMTRWSQTRGSQSLLSMHPHERLVVLVEKFGIGGFFTEVSGMADGQSERKAPHLRRHLDRIGVDPANALLIGDSVDDALAARECGVPCLLYHAGDNALHALEHFTSLGIPVVTSLHAAVEGVLDGTQDLVTWEN